MAKKSKQGSTVERVQYATEQLTANSIEFSLKNDVSGHFHCRRKSDDKLIQFWAGTGKILGFDDQRGIHNLIELLNTG